MTLDDQRVRVFGDLEFNTSRAGVLGDVGECFGADVVAGDYDLARQHRPNIHDHVHGNR